ncbi:MAG TPA: protease complex subunit PrcB family protein [Actinoplanes sp.]|nr:protease complex subunit PrcB family protein [Actinoplanes sp.]
MATTRALLHGSAPLGTHVSALPPGLFLLRTPREWESSWKAMTKGITPSPDLPPVDWTSEVVVLLVLGFRATGGYGITITDVVTRWHHLEVHATEERPGDGMVTEAETMPVHAVAAPIAAVRDTLLLIQRVVTRTG